MEKRILIFLLLSFAIIFSFDFILKELGLMPEPPPVEEGQEAFPTGDQPFPPTGSLQDASSGIRPYGDETAPLETHVEEVETPLYRVTFANRERRFKAGN